MAKSGSYLNATRHPLPCLLFILPILLSYEILVLVLGGSHPEGLRSGADDWLRTSLAAAWPPLEWLTPVSLLATLGIWTYRQFGERPSDLLGVISGMGIESVAFALGLWLMHRMLVPFLQGMGMTLAAGTDPSIRALIPYVGAGLYEEALFRLALFSALLWVLLRVETIPWLAIGLAAVGSASLFAAAHYLGPNEASWNAFVFFFRLMAGVYFALLYQQRGFGIVVGAHACYNIMVTVGTL